MYDRTITVFNFHDGMWYPSVISAVNLLDSKSRNASVNGCQNTDAVEIIIHCAPDKSIDTSAGRKSYTGPKAYAKLTKPEEFITFQPECDFIYDGEWAELSPVSDDDYDEGLYHALNEKHDGIYMITSAAFFGLLPHFEIGGR